MDEILITDPASRWYWMIFIVEEWKGWGVLAYADTPDGKLYARFNRGEYKYQYRTVN